MIDLTASDIYKLKHCNPRFEITCRRFGRTFRDPSVREHIEFERCKTGVQQELVDFRQLKGDT